VCHRRSQNDEIQDLREVFRQNIYNAADFTRNIRICKSGNQLGWHITVPAPTSYKISRLLAKLVKIIYIPATKNTNMFRPVKDDSELKTSGVCSM
jgi:hypothetical protein